MKASLRKAVNECVSVFDTTFFKALCEPSRIAVLRELILLGRSDIGGIAAQLPQDRSVIARHLQQLAAAQIVTADKQGRHVYYQVDPEAIAVRLESITETTHKLAAAMAGNACSTPAKTKK
ncbi:MAG: metalloregulator ArsR/SmtB family transcription factor [Alphaproteobacteria bacterium]|nr:metalloregulator ArsR/SmtB family transcription factor [Alphaproteobacteria bacterium]